MTDMLDPFIQQITTVKGPSAVVVCLIMLGYVLKMFNWFPNRLIPLVNFVAGPVLTLFIVAWPTATSMDPGLRWPTVAAWLTSLVQGLLLACLAWVMHAKFLSKWIDDKVPALNPGRTVATSTETEERTSEAGTQLSTLETKVTLEKPEPPKL